MAEKARFVEDHRAGELIMASPDPSPHKRIGRGVRNVDSAVRCRKKQNAVLSGNNAKFTQNPAMKHRRLSSGNKRLAKASPVGSVWGIGLRADDPRAKDPRQWRGENLLGEALSAVRQAIRDSETGLTHPASAGRFCTPTGNAGIHEISSAPQSCSLTTASACQGPLSEFSTYFSDAPADQSHEGMEKASGVGPGVALSEHDPCLVGGTVTLDDVSLLPELHYIAEGTPLRFTDAWRSSIRVPPKPSSDVTCWIVCVWSCLLYTSPSPRD